MTLPVSDSFTGIDGQALISYSANWSVNSGTFEIESNGVRSATVGGTGESAARWNADAFAANHYAQLKIIIASGSRYIGPAVRLKTDGTANYYGYYMAYGFRYLMKNVNGSVTYMASISQEAAAEHTLRLEAESSSITPTFDGVLDAAIGVQTDSAHTTGQAGISGYGQDATGAIGDDFLADNLGAAPAVGAGPQWRRMDSFYEAGGY